MTAPPSSAPVPLDELWALAHAHERDGRLEAAERLLRRILDAAPRHVEALCLLGVVAHRQGRPEEALELMRRALAHGIDTPLYLRNACEMYRTLDRLEEAEAAARQAVELNPADPAALVNLGAVLADATRLDEAVACFERAVALDPALAGAHFGLAEALLARGDFARGWEEYEWRFRLPDSRVPLPQMPQTERPQWDGTKLPGGTLLLVADQGFGDAFQFGRYVPWAAARCRDVALACSPELRPVLAGLHPGLRLFTEWRECGEFAAWCPLTGLPRLAGTVADTIPAALPYLRADPARRARWAARLRELVPDGMLRVGLVWAGRASHRNDRRRSMVLDALAPVAALDGVALVALQKGPAQRQVGDYRGRAPLVQLGTELADFADTMAAATELDLVLSVDTSVAHLVGAMGLPVWIMLPHAAEWRWMVGRADTPWYPTARLFRQPAPRRWDLVAAKVASCLESERETSLARRAGRGYPHVQHERRQDPP